MTLKELEKRVAALEDIEDIKKLHREYLFWFNNQQWEEMIDCFAENATAEIGAHGLRRGKEEITKLFKINIANRVTSWKGGHFVTQPVISIDGDKATGHWLLHIFVFHTQTPTGPSYKWTQGRYDCEYAKVNGKWKFSSLKFTNPWPEKLDLGQLPT
jgi:ketosteroid isomerase-like protein